MAAIDEQDCWRDEIVEK